MFESKISGSVVGYGIIRHPATATSLGDVVGYIAIAIDKEVVDGRLTMQPRDAQGEPAIRNIWTPADIGALRMLKLGTQLNDLPVEHYAKPDGSHSLRLAL